MIRVVQFDEHQATPGQRRLLELEGNEPFRVSTSCFIDSPPPPGFRSCPECGSRVIRSHELLVLTIPRFFGETRHGRLFIRIVDAVGEVLQLQVEVVSDDEPRGSGSLAFA